MGLRCGCCTRLLHKTAADGDERLTPRPTSPTRPYPTVPYPLPLPISKHHLGLDLSAFASPGSSKSQRRAQRPAALPHLSRSLAKKNFVSPHGRRARRHWSASASLSPSRTPDQTCTRASSSSSTLYPSQPLRLRSTLPAPSPLCFALCICRGISSIALVSSSSLATSAARSRPSTRHFTRFRTSRVCALLSHARDFPRRRLSYLRFAASLGKASNCFATPVYPRAPHFIDCKASGSPIPLRRQLPMTDLSKRIGTESQQFEVCARAGETCNESTQVFAQHPPRARLGGTVLAAPSYAERLDG